MRRRGMWVVALAVLAALTAGCGSDDSDRPGTPAEDAGWRTSADPVDTSGLIWASGSTVHLSDGTEIDAGGPMAAYVVAGDGAFFFRADDPDDAGSGLPLEGDLLFAHRDGSVSDTDLRILGRSLAASADGRYLAAIDTASGVEDQFGTPQGTVVAFDLETGEQVVSSTDGMGDPAEDDFAALYPELEMNVPLLEGAKLYVDAGGSSVYDLTTGDGQELEDDQLPDPDPESPESPDGAWKIVETGTYTDRLVGRDGREVTPQTRTSRWSLKWWADDVTVVGSAISGPGRGSELADADSARLMSCVVPSGECEVIDQTSGVLLQFPVRAAGAIGVVLKAGADS